MGTKVFVSGCYDILHAGHIKFFEQARSLGDTLTVCFASDAVLYKHKRRCSSLPQDHKKTLLTAIALIDEVVMGEEEERGLDFKMHFLRVRPDILAVTEDDGYEGLKRELCASIGCKYVVLPKESVDTSVSTTSIVRSIKAPLTLPLRVDFGGGWLDVPKFSRPQNFIVNCSVSPLVSLFEWPYELQSGLGGSAAWAMLNGKDGVLSELDLGVGWQDPAIIKETGLCVWRSGEIPILEFKRNGDFLNGLMAIHFTGTSHDTPGNVDQKRDFDLISLAGNQAAFGVLQSRIDYLAQAIKTSYHCQLLEGMIPLETLPSKALAWKYLGGGFGGYALYLFANREDRDEFVNISGTIALEPYLRSV